MLPRPGFCYYDSECGNVRAKVISRNSTDVSYIVDGVLRYCTIGEFGELFNLLSKHIWPEDK